MWVVGVAGRKAREKERETEKEKEKEEGEERESKCMCMQASVCSEGGERKRHKDK